MGIDHVFSSFFEPIHYLWDTEWVSVARGTTVTAHGARLMQMRKGAEYWIGGIVTKVGVGSFPWIRGATELESRLCLQPMEATKHYLQNDKMEELGS